MVLAGFFDVVVDDRGRCVCVTDGREVVAVVFGFVVVVAGGRQVVGFGVVVLGGGCVEDRDVLCAGTVTVTVTVEGSTTTVCGGSVLCVGDGACTDTLPLSETLGHCDAAEVSVIVDGAGVSVCVSVAVSVTTGSPLTPATGAASVIVTASEAIGSSLPPTAPLNSSSGGGTSLGVSDTETDAVGVTSVVL
ncbi:hypothetical protein [Nocardia sp. CA-135398]|uniref:hypothetical protein n=1 Tax=Nocardia sp. CA-135398 TaxID=3239977 RepID=UPI003D99547A